MAQGLQILRVGKLGPVPSVWLNVIYVYPRGPPAMLGALPAKRLPQQLAGAQFISPRLGAVHPAPACRGFPSGLLGVMLRTVTVPGQLRAPRVPAWSQGLMCHGLSPPGETKAPGPTTQPNSGKSLALALYALAFFDIQDNFASACPAVHSQVFSLGFRINAEQAVVPPTLRAGNPSILYLYFTMLFSCLQHYLPPFMRYCQKIYTASRPNSGKRYSFFRRFCGRRYLHSLLMIGSKYLR